MILISAIPENSVPFQLKVVDIADRLGIDPNWLMAVMFKESLLNHRAQNSKTNAVGLIQFMPATATSLGTTVTSLLHITNVEQMEYVYQYLKPYKFKLKSYVDVYLAVFFPAAIGKPADWVLQSTNLSPAIIASQNKPLDWNSDNKLTVGEVERWALAGFTPEIVQKLKKKA